MLSHVACVEIKVARNLYCRTQCAFLLNLLVFIRGFKCVYIYMYLISCYDVKDAHCSILSKNLHLHKMHYIGGSGIDRKRQRKRLPP